MLAIGITFDGDEYVRIQKDFHDSGTVIFSTSGRSDNPTVCDSNFLQWSQSTDYHCLTPYDDDPNTGYATRGRVNSSGVISSVPFTLMSRLVAAFQDLGRRGGVRCKVDSNVS
jgi:hypothetical protein